MLQSVAVRTLPHAAFKILVLLAAQFTGRNNGTLAMTELWGRRFGFTSRDTIYRSLAELVGRGLIVQTRKGIKSKTHFALYALNWRPIHNRGGQPLDHAESPTRTWEKWNSTGFPTTGSDGKKMQTGHRESCLPTAGNDEAGSVPISPKSSPESFPTIGNTLRISERGDRGAPERTRDRSLAAKPSTTHADAAREPQHVGGIAAKWVQKL